MTERMHKGNKIVWMVIFGLLVFLIFNKHSKDKLGTYQHAVWADRSGYFIFLPFTFDYHCKAIELPDSLNHLLGYGFKIDTVSQKLQTKCVTGVALMQVGFYGVAKFYRSFSEVETSNQLVPYGLDGLSMASLYIGAAFFFTLGLYLLYSSLRFYFSPTATVVSLLGIVLGTNVLYYAIDELLMTHIYSFFWFSVLLYTLIRISVLHQYSRLNWFVLCLSVGFIVLLRPTNSIYIVAMGYIFLNKQVYYQFLKDRTFEKIVIAFLTISILFLPQLIYLNYAFGSFFYNPYQGERFENWLQPKVLEVLFAPNNGLFVYSPILILSFWGIVRMKNNIDYKKWSLTILWAFMLVTYMTASWWTYDFGCGFGARNFVEYSVLLVFPLAYLIQHSQGATRYGLIGLVCAIAIWNTRLMYHYDKCWFGTSDWDYSTWVDLVVN
jgi:hypothetical protein